MDKKDKEVIKLLQENVELKCKLLRSKKIICQYQNLFKKIKKGEI